MKKLIDLVLNEDDYSRIAESMVLTLQSRTDDPMTLSLFDSVIKEDDTYNLFRTCLKGHVENKFNKEELEYLFEILNDPIVKQFMTHISNFTLNETVFHPFHDYIQARVKELYDEYIDGIEDRKE